MKRLPDPLAGICDPQIDYPRWMEEDDRLFSINLTYVDMLELQDWYEAMRLYYNRPKKAEVGMSDPPPILLDIVSALLKQGIIEWLEEDV